jgi:phosphoribosylformylglycinamidine synthase
VDIAEQAAAQRFVREAVRVGALTGAHDISEGGLACALAEMAVAGGIGARCDLDALIEARGSSGETAAFGEGPGGFLLTGPAEPLERLGAAAEGAGVDFWRIGAAEGSEIRLSAAELELSVPFAAAEGAWRSLEARLQH